MATDKELERARRRKKFEEGSGLETSGPAQPALGPSDSSDSGNDLPPYAPDTDSDRGNTGERPQVENTGEGPLNDDIEADKIVPDEAAGLAHTPPDPARNGGKEES